MVGDSVALTVLRDRAARSRYASRDLFVRITLAWRVALGSRHAGPGLLGWVLVNLMNSTDVYPTKAYLWLFAALVLPVAVRSSDPVQRFKSNYAGRASGYLLWCSITPWRISW